MKLRLIGDALTARDRGDLLAAKRAIDELSQLSANDPDVQRLRTEIQAQIEVMKKATAEISAQASNTPPPAGAAVGKVDGSKKMNEENLVDAINRAAIREAPPSIQIVPKRVSFFSTTAFVGEGDRRVAVAFTVEGVEPRVVLIRAIGPGLKSPAMKRGFLKEPLIKLIDGSAKVLASNSDWKGSVDAAFMGALVASGGGRAFNSTDKDAAIVTTLPPGSYSVVFEGLRGGTGIGALEIYQFIP